MLSELFQNLKVIILIGIFGSAYNCAKAEYAQLSKKSPSSVSEPNIEKSISRDLKLALGFFGEFLDINFSRLVEEYKSDEVLELDISKISSLRSIKYLFEGIDRQITQFDLQKGLFNRRLTLKWNYQHFLEEIVAKLAIAIQRLKYDEVYVGTNLKVNQILEKILHLLASNMIGENDLTAREVRELIEQTLLNKLNTYESKNDELTNVETRLILVVLDFLKVDFTKIRKFLKRSKIHLIKDFRVKGNLVKLLINSAIDSNQLVWEEAKFKITLLNNLTGLSDRKAVLTYRELEKLLIESIDSREDYIRAIEIAQDFNYPMVFRALVGLSEHFSANLGIHVENESIFLNYFTADHGINLTEDTGVSSSEIDWRELVHLVDYIRRVSPSEEILSRALSKLRLSPHAETQQHINQFTEENQKASGQIKTSDKRMNEFSDSIKKLLQEARSLGNYSNVLTFLETNFDKIKFYYIELIQMTVRAELIQKSRTKLEPFIDILVESYFLSDVSMREQIWNLLSVPQSLVPDLSLDEIRVKILSRIFKNLIRIYYDSVDKNNCNEHILNIFAELYIKLLNFLEDLIELSDSSNRKIYKEFLFGRGDFNDLLRGQYRLWKQLFPDIGNKIVQANYRYLEFGKNIKLTNGTCVKKVTIGR